jgi:hypothetical protein
MCRLRHAAPYPSLAAEVGCFRLRPGIKAAELGYTPVRLEGEVLALQEVMLFLLRSADGTTRTCRDVCYVVGIGGKADVPQAVLDKPDL